MLGCDHYVSLQCPNYTDFDRAAGQVTHFPTLLMLTTAVELSSCSSRDKPWHKMTKVFSLNSAARSSRQFMCNSHLWELHKPPVFTLLHNSPPPSLVVRHLTVSLSEPVSESLLSYSTETGDSATRSAPSGLLWTVPKLDHNCDWFWENPPSMHNYKYLEKPILITRSIITQERKQILAWNLPWFYSYL